MPHTQPCTEACCAVVGLASCTSPNSGAGFSAKWEGTIEHQTIHESVDIAVMGDVLFVSDPESGVIHRFYMGTEKCGEALEGVGHEVDRLMCLAGNGGGNVIVAEIVRAIPFSDKNQIGAYFG